MMRKPLGHKEKYSNRHETSQSHSIDGTSARTRPYSFDDIMLRRKNKRLSESTQDQRLASQIVSSKETESVSGHVESNRHRNRDVHGGSEHHAFNEPLKSSSRTKENKSIREDKRVEYEHKETNNAQRRSEIISVNAKDRRKERDFHFHDYVNEHGKRHGKDFEVKERDRNAERNREKSEHVNRLNENGSRKRHERDKRRSISPSSRSNKQRLHEVKEHEKELLSSSKDKQGRFDSNKRVSNNGSSNTNSKRHSHDTSNRLGGYSPRKRRNDSVVKTPPPITSPNVKMEAKVSTPLTSLTLTQPDLASLTKIEVPKPQEVSNVVPLSIPKPNFGLLFPSIMNTSVDSVQLTQATRPKRRIYVENLPSSATEVNVVEWLSGYLRPFGVNHVQTTSPCISCIVNKDKGQALVEFLTPEDTSSALSFDGKSFFGNVVKIRRPKDYVETSDADEASLSNLKEDFQTGSGVSVKPLAGGALSIKNTVQDSPNKIFIGGISKTITSEMLMQIASAFGPLKAYHFENNPNLNTTCAFLEYADQSVTIKAFVGLNGMKLGGQLLTVTQATPNTSTLENHGDQPFYGTPAHAQPLLKKPTQVLKLNNLVDPQSLSSLSEQELEELLEDVRLECARFGMVKSINIIKPTDGPTRGTKSTDQNKSHDDVAVKENFMENDISREIDKLEMNERKSGGDDVAEVEGVGCVMVEYKRIEASRMAAHCLHGRMFDGRVVSVEYVAHDVYCSRIGK